MTIERITARPILDSRGTWTLEACVGLSDGTQFRVGVPQGTSAGSREAVSQPAHEAAANVNEQIAPKIVGLRADQQERLDEALRELDGTPDKARLGANALLGVSVASAAAAAQAKQVPLWQHLTELYRGGEPRFPRVYANLLNGGLHAGWRETFQEYLVIPRERQPHSAIAFIVDLYTALGDLLRERFGAAAALVGLEGGYAPRFEDPVAPFHVMQEAAERCGDSAAFSFGLDAAAGEIARDADELTELYRRMAREVPLVYLEDPFAEDALERFAQLQSDFGKDVALAGDDLTATQTSHMRAAHEAGAVSAVIIKPNQVGTLSETFEAVRLARRYHWEVVVSHRSGETNDAWIAEVAYAVAADGFKLGAPARGERVAKYNRLLALSERAR